MHCVIKWFCVRSGVKTTDYTNNLLRSTYNLCKWIDAVVPQIWTQYEISGSISASYKFSNVSNSNDLRAFMIIPVPLAILREIHFMCSSQFSLNVSLSLSSMIDCVIIGHQYNTLNLFVGNGSSFLSSNFHHGVNDMFNYYDGPACFTTDNSPHETARYGEIASAILNFFVCCMEMG